MNILAKSLITMLLPVIAGTFAFGITQATKRLWTQLDQQPAQVKQAVALAWSFIFAALSKVINAPICADGVPFCDPPAVLWQTVVTYAISVTIHGNWRKRKG